MKKLLALVLALVMVMSLCITSNAAFAGEEFDYDEAVEVMTAVGVFQGDENGKFNPTGILTREQAAKIVTYMLLGKKAADALVTIAAPFADVEATRWSAGSIAYCYNEGILAGVGNGMFAPASELTGLAFAKMMLTALGYDAEVEGLTGTNWSINVAKLALTTGLTDGLDDVSLSAPMTREQAAKMAFNTELATMVEYKDQSTITAGNVTIKTQASATKVAAATTRSGFRTTYAGYVTSGENDAYLQFCEQYCKDLKLNVADDDFGRDSNKWTYKNDSVGSFAADADVVYTAEVKLSAIYADLGLDEAVAAANVNFFVNGYDTESNLYDNSASPVALSGLGLSKSTSNKIGGDGMVIEVYYDSDAETVDVVMYQYFLAKAAEDYNESDEDIELTVFSTAFATAELEADDFEEIKGLKKDDYVVLTATTDDLSAYAVESVAKADVVENEPVSKVRVEDYVVAGEKYTYADASVADSEALGNDFMTDNSKYALNKDGYNLYLDPNGYVLGVEGYEAGTNLDNYLFVKTKSTNGFDAIAKVLFVDGTTKTVTVDKVGSNDVDASTNYGDLVGSKFYKFAVDKDGNYELTVVPTGGTAAKVNQTSNTSTIKAGAKPALDMVGTSATKFIAKSTVYEGTKNAPTVASSPVYALYDNNSRLLLVYSGTAGSATTSADNLIYILNDNPAAAKDGDNDYYIYDAIVDGAKTTLEANDGGKAVGLYKVETYTDGRADLGSAITSGDLINYDADVDAAAYKDGTATFDTEGYILADDCTILTVEGNTVKTIAASGIAKAVTDGFDELYAIETSSSNDDIALLILVK